MEGIGWSQNSTIHVRMPPLGTPLAGSTFNLNSAGVAGFFGGKEAISAMATVHLYEGGRWLGWYNSPGSYTIAKRFGRMANSRFWDGLFPGPNDSPAISFGLDGKPGPKYIAALSGTTMETAHLGYLTMKRSKELVAERIQSERKSKPFHISYLAIKEVDYIKPVQRRPLENALFAIIPITVSAVACILSALVYDWYSFSMILLGMISSGLASFVIGKGKLVIKSVNNPPGGCPPGDGILMGQDEVIVIKGREEDVNAITRGHFDLETEPQGGDEENGAQCCYHGIGFASLLLLVQFLLQLLLVPQGSLFGQVMFLSSLVVSWGYSSYFSSLEKEKVQADILFNALGKPDMVRFRVETRTAMAVFVCLLLFHGVKVSWHEERTLREKILCSCIPNDTVVWGRWRKKVIDQLISLGVKSDLLTYLDLDEKDEIFGDDDKKLLTQLLEDAKAAINGYFDVRSKLYGS